MHVQGNPQGSSRQQQQRHLHLTWYMQYLLWDSSCAAAGPFTSMHPSRLT